MISRDRLNFLNPRFLVEREIFSQSLQLPVNQTINPPGTSSKAPKLLIIKGFGVLLLWRYANRGAGSGKMYL
jgi:hypothetical protein